MLIFSSSFPYYMHVTHLFRATTLTYADILVTDSVYLDHIYHYLMSIHLFVCCLSLNRN